MANTIDDMFNDVSHLRSHGKHETREYTLVALNGEVGELCNFVKKELRNPLVCNRNEIVKEIPDILFYLFQFCQIEKIDLVKAWNDKMEYNSSKYGRSRTGSV